MPHRAPVGRLLSRRRWLSGGLAAGLALGAGRALAQDGEGDALALAPDDVLPRQPLSPWTGGAAPALEATDLAGAPRTLAEWRGRIVVVNFWATWCAPCRLEMPSFAALAARWAANGLTGELVLVSVNHGEMPARVQQFLRHTPWPGQVWLDRSRTQLARWQSDALPSSFVVDRAGQRRWMHRGELDWGSAFVHNQLRALL
ncbi:MAG: Thiol-disulfide oxidoreductase ResA [Paracidovorax wautersii]|uniref:Thiol-disulfide oxidoreductase ResA n=1 Tax=Paracidovorax wautersii TaxID=1177982 RepID=A0A7V8FRU1_9BURK|nr:MAG: Thiol-disulfide oxidoreductase ResA [Paracidovorax wautersii]